MNNQQAFPTCPPNVLQSGLYEYGAIGMTLLDYFAAKAMQAMINAASSYDDSAKSKVFNDDDTKKYLVKTAYEYAKEMMTLKDQIDKESERW